MNKKIIKMFKNNWLFILLMFFVMTFGYVLGSSVKVDAYHIDEETGNIVSDNEMSLSELLVANIDNGNLSSAESLSPTNYVYSYTTGKYTWWGPCINNLQLVPNTEYIITFDYLDNTENIVWAAFFNNDTHDFTENFESGFIFVTNDTGVVSFIWEVNEPYSTASISNIMIKQTSSTATEFEPYGKVYYYSPSSYDEGIKNSYNEGYDTGYSDNKGIPNFYYSSSSLIYSYNGIGGTNANAIVLDPYIMNYRATLDFSKLLSSSFDDRVYDQLMYFEIVLDTKINVNDSITIDFNEIRSSNFSNDFFIIFSGSSCLDSSPTCAVALTYEDIVSRDNNIVLSEINSNLNISEINSIFGIYSYENGRFEGVTSIINNTLYNSGTSADYDVGYRVGYTHGKNDGYGLGNTTGYDKGYSDGYKKASQIVSKPGNNTLVGMVGTLIETPVNMFIDIFNFEFLGVNLVTFFFSLLSLIIVVWLIKYLK